jgi:hypothetical protein
MGGSTYYVDKDAPGPFHNGTSWKWAFTNLQDALAVAVSGDTILVAEGTYKPDEGGSMTLGDRTVSFQLQNGVILLGSCAGYGQFNPDARDTNTYTSILSGDLNGDDSWANKNDNSYQVVTVTDCISCDAVLDGFTITGGQADGPIPYNMGGGIYVDGTNPMLINCTISYNNADSGGGIASTNGGSPYILNCKIMDNKAQFFGGGLFCYSNYLNLINCLITGNSATLSEYIGGSAIYNIDGSITIINCTIANNPGLNGMAIASFAGNLPTSHYLNVYNCILYNGGNEILTNHINNTSVNYTCIQSGWAGPGAGNISTDPMFVNSGDFHLQPGSPCYNAGSNSFLPNDEGDLDNDSDIIELLPLDLDYTTRILDGIINMGAYEQSGTPTPQQPDPSWQYLYTINITHTKIQDNPSASLSNTVTVTLPIPIQGNIKLWIEPTSPAGGNWSAWLDPDPGIVGPGPVTVTIQIEATNVDLTQFPSGPNQDIADLDIYIKPI